MYIKANTTDLGWPGAALPNSAETEAWIEQIVTIPGGASTLQAGVAWNTVTNGQIFYLNEFEIVQLTTVTPEYQYHLKDHLGNVRVTFTSKEETDTYTATLEDNTQAEEQATFKNYSRVTADVYDHTDAGTTYDKAQLLNGGNNSQVGLTKSLAVMPGDTVTAQVYAKYFESTGGSGNLSGFAAALLSAFGLPTPAGGEAGTAAAALQDYGAFIAGGGNSGTSGWPKGWLNMLVFDKDFNLVDLAFEQLDEAYMQPVGNPNKLPMQQLSVTKTIKEPGYVYIYLSNEGDVQQDIYFDDLTITHEKSRVVQGDDYYPFGATFNSYSRENSVPNKELYQSKEWQDELELNLYDFEWRQYDPYIARTTTLDPHAENYLHLSPYSWTGNNPIMFIDPNGMDFVIAKYKNLSDEDKAKYSKSEYRQMRKEGKEAIRNLKRESSTARAMIKDLDKSENTHTVSFTKDPHGSNQQTDRETGNSIIVVSLTETTEGLENQSQEINTTVLAGHEIAHSWREEQGLDPKPMSASEAFKDMTAFFKNEDQRKGTTENGATHIENMIRSELKVPLRRIPTTKYTL